MPIVTLPEAKLHLRVDHSDEDALISVWIAAAEESARQHIERNIYADATALSTAIDAAPAALTAATSAYEAAVTAPRPLLMMLKVSRQWMQLRATTHQRLRIPDTHWQASLSMTQSGRQFC